MSSQCHLQSTIYCIIKVSYIHLINLFHCFTLDSTEYLTTAVNATVESAKTSLASSRESSTFNQGAHVPFR